MLDERQEGRENIYINVRFLDLLTSDRNDFKADASGRSARLSA